MLHKKISLKILLIACLIGLFSFNKTLAQVVVLGDSTKINSLILNECNQSDTFEIFIRVASGSLVSTVNLKDSFLNNFIVTSVLSNAAVLSTSGLNTSVINMTLDAAALNGAGVSGTRIRILLRARCGANGLLAAEHYMRLTDGNGFSINKTSGDFVSSIKAATLILEARNTVNQPNAVLGNDYTRVWRVRNSGTNSEIDTVWFKVVHQPGLTHQTLQVDGVTVTPTAQVADTLWYRIIKKFRNQSAFPGDTSQIRETYRVTACTPAGTNSRVSAYWGCYNSPVCDESVLTPTTGVPSTVPTLTQLGAQFYNGTNTSNVRGSRLSTCAGQPSSQIAWVRNSSSTTANGVRVTITSASDWAFPNQYDLSTFISTNASLGRANNAIDTSSLFYRVGANGSWRKITQSNWIASDTGTRNNGPSGCGSSITWPNITFILTNVPVILQANDTLFFTWNQFTKCCTGCGDYHANEATVRFDYQNACGLTFCQFVIAIVSYLSR